MLHTQGIRSVRIHIVKVVMDHGPRIEDLKRVIHDTAEAIHQEGLDWTIDGQFSLSTWAKLVPFLFKLNDQYGTRFVADHTFCAGPEATEQEDLEKCLDLVENGIVFVKISALNKYSPQGMDKMTPVLEQVIKCTQGEMVFWGSDWPHVNLEGESEDVDLEGQLEFLKAVCDQLGEGYWEKLMRDNAARIYA